MKFPGFGRTLSAKTTTGSNNSKRYRSWICIVLRWRIAKLAYRIYDRTTAARGFPGSSAEVKNDRARRRVFGLRKNGRNGSCIKSVLFIFNFFIRPREIIILLLYDEGVRGQCAASNYHRALSVSIKRWSWDRIPIKQNTMRRRILTVKNADDAMAVVVWVRRN